MDDDPSKPRHSPSVSKMSKTPSWVMLGFVLGVLFVVALPDRKTPPPAAPAPPPAEPAPAKSRPPPPLTRIEAVFAEWGKYAVWSDDTTEVALWEPAEERYSDCYEARRVDGVLYFRSIPKLTRKVIERGKQLAESPLLFTETEEQFREWDERDRTARPLSRMWKPPAPRLPSADPRAPALNVPPPEQQKAPVIELRKPDLDDRGEP